MTGGLIQLKSKGDQNIYLSGNATTSYFNTIFRKRMDFAIEPKELSYKGNADFGNRIMIDLIDYGDLVHSCGLAITLPSLSFATEAAWVEQIGHVLIKEVSIEIAGLCIDKHYGVWMSIWNEMTLPLSKEIGYHNLIGNTSDLKGTTLSLIKTSPIPSKNIYVPLSFWFNRNISLALPLISLQSDEQPRIIVEFEQLYNLVRGDPILTNVHLTNVKFSADYIFLSEIERKWYTKNSFEVVIDQLQLFETTKKGPKHNVLLNSFNHPLIEIVFVARNQELETATDITKSFVTFTDTNGRNPIEDAELRINNIERFKILKGIYFNKIQPLQHHSRVPYLSGINMYCFAEQPETIHDYTGSLNVTNIDNIVLNITLNQNAQTKNNRIMVFARNYNVLVFKNGFGRVLYTI